MSKIEDAVCEKLQARAKLGLSRYGVSLVDAKLTRLQALIHAQEEALDLANYLEVEIRREQGIDASKSAWTNPAPEDEGGIYGKPS